MSNIDIIVARNTNRLHSTYLGFKAAFYWPIYLIETFLPNVVTATYYFALVVLMYLKDLIVFIALAAAFPLVNLVRGLTGNLNSASSN